MRLFQKVKDGGPDSPVTAYVLIEIKNLFSIMLLHFPASTAREAYHNHAFNAVTLWLQGEVTEINKNGPITRYKAGQFKYTPRSMFHKIMAGANGAWALSLRGPWRKWWQEYKYDPKIGRQRYFTLTNGRKEI